MTKNLFRSSLLLALALPLVAMAQVLPGKHPGYLHALSDLRAARWFLYHQPGDANVSAHEDAGIAAIDAAIAEIKRAAIDDKKDLNDHPAVNLPERGSRLLKSIESLKKARENVVREEDNAEARTLRKQALQYIDRALREAEAAHADWLKSRKS